MAIQLVAFDLDGTLVRGETCVQAMARRIGRAEECAAFEQLGMRDEVAITSAREEIARWFDEYPEEFLLAGLSELSLAPGTERAFALLHARGVATAIASLTWSRAVEWFASRLGATHAVGTQHRGTEIDHVWPADKGRWLTELSRNLGLRQDRVAAVGDSDGDRELLEAAGLRFFVGDAPPSVPDTVHIPSGDIAEIAERVLAWGHASTDPG